MKQLLAILILALAPFVLTNCSKIYSDATVVRNCTGEYLKMGKKHFLVENKEILSGIDTGSSIDVKYERVLEPEPSNEIICLLYFEFEGVIRVTELK